MSQSFSLYTELTVQQNLLMHARLYGQRGPEAKTRINALVHTFGLAQQADTRAGDLPLGIRQRLSLAVAVVHRPDILILDEPTSGVDPLARDLFWNLLHTLSRQDRVTVFVSTHFMEEGERCDRVALMHAGRVLSCGAPDELVAQSGGANLEEAFIAQLERADASTVHQQGAGGVSLRLGETARPIVARFSPRRLLTFSWREALELSRDRIRLGFAIAGAAFLFLVLSLGVNTDVDHIAFAALDLDRTPESRLYLQSFGSTPYFAVQAPLGSEAELSRRLIGGGLKVGIEIPPGFGRRLRRGTPTDVGVWVDGAMPFRAETSRGYVEGAHDQFLAAIAAMRNEPTAPARIETRFRYNQSFESINALVPGNLAMMLALIPAVLMALAVVREKEFGSIVNLYVTPATRLEFLVGKQVPYVVLAMISFALMAAMAAWGFGVPIKGSVKALAAGTLLYVCATTAYGLLISCFAGSQIAALFGAAILTTVPAQQFSGMITPYSALTGVGAVMGALFPMTYYVPISVGCFTKSLGFPELRDMMMRLALFAPALVGLSLAMLRRQER